MTISALALQGNIAEHARALKDSGAHALLVRRVSEPDQVDGLVILDDESMTMSNLLPSFGLFDTLNDRIASGLPVYGTCTDMIMLASSILDGREDQRSSGALDMAVCHNVFGRQVNSYEKDLNVEGVRGGPPHVMFTHAPWAESVGKGIEVIACIGNSTDGPIVDVRRGNAVATSFHPEVGGDDRIHAVFVGMVARA